MLDDTGGEIRVMIADDHPLLRSGIAAVLSHSARISVVAEAGDGDMAVELFRQQRPDITLMDLQMPGLGGIEAIAAIRRIDPQARIIILTTFSGDAQIYRGLKAGASGYLLKNMARTELLDYLFSIYRGDRRLPAEVSRNLPTVMTMEPLTRREVDVLKLVATGHSNQRAAGELGLKEDTIKAYMKSILAKLRARDRTHAVTIALKRGFWEV
ncbi:MULTISPECIES: response regulator transcription factor [unclassified Duganella]|uniref:response regulator transcription factor n=1 Tax=unclassified Duganella TaxID=2636909 RepID=UPI000887F897|nr:MULTISPECIES: response regulator transcription factor [unclassified Duganella]SDF77228.1 two component transcriptional regulator, LuxR family [Duganella sp. OV458]SDI51921.1 two component transcriptional regulator, LuxR family [Duganella sp. OV510]